MRVRSYRPPLMVFFRVVHNERRVWAERSTAGVFEKRAEVFGVCLFDFCFGDTTVCV